MENCCYHCGDQLPAKEIIREGKKFCCKGCESVFFLLKDNNLTSFYDLESQSGLKPKNNIDFKFEFLDIPGIREKYLDFEDDKQVRITLFLPEIHCSSCIYLLENITKIDQRIFSSTVNFSARKANFVIDNNTMKLSELANLLARIGYEPSFQSTEKTKTKTRNIFLYKFGVAGFAFGSIMLWSFPEYLGVEIDNPEIRNFTSYLSFAVSIPVLLFSARDYFVSAYKAIKFKSINLDVPIALGILALYLQSLWSIFSQDGPGYMDSFSGFIFFLLIGKWFQNRTFQSMSFERDYKSYFPIAITKLVEGKKQLTEIENLSENDHILLRNEEIVPCDSILMSESAKFDFSFVSGESNLISKKKGDFIFAGGKVSGVAIELQVKNATNRSHLTQLWNEKSVENEKVDKSFSDKISVYFLFTVLIIALFSSFFWIFADESKAVHVFVSVLIVTCPCALALSSPFTLGNTMSVLGRKGLYLKNAAVVEKLNKITDVVFDKTGTLTKSSNEIEIQGANEDFSKNYGAIISLVKSSSHPISIAIYDFLSKFEPEEWECENFSEIAGKGILGTLKSRSNEEIDVKIGSASFTNCQEDGNYELGSFVTINGEFAAKFILKSNFRENLREMLSQLSSYRTHVLTGDSEKDKSYLLDLFCSESNLYFNQSPLDKLEFIRKLQQDENRHVLMIGDGLNDAGALREAYSSIAITEEGFRFTPASDAIIEGNSLKNLHHFLKISNKAKIILKVCLSFSFLYNVIGLSIAISGNLTPLIAAILMPISSITVVFLSTFLVFFGSKQKK